MKTFETRIEQLRVDLIEAIIAIMKENNTTQMELSDLVCDPTFVIWFDKNGYPSEWMVKRVTYASNRITLSGYCEETGEFEECYSSYNLGARNIDWLDSVRQNMLETLKINREDNTAE